MSGIWPRDTFLDRVAPWRVPLAAVGTLLVLVGCFTRWSYYSGFPGKMALDGYPGGARAYCLALLVFAAFAFWRRPGGDTAGEAAALGIVAIAVITAGTIAKDGVGLIDVQFGAYLTIVGGVLLYAAFASQPRDDEAPRLELGGNRGLELAAVVVAIGAILFLVVEGLSIDASSQFLMYLVGIGFFLFALSRTGLLSWVQRASERHRNITVAAAVISAAVFPLTQQGNNYWLRVAASVGLFAATVVGLNIVVGLAGLLDLGYVAFFGVGAYVGASLSGAAASNIGWNPPFLLVMLIGATLAAVFGLIIGAPTLRLRGDYLAIVTLAFGEIFVRAMNNLDGDAGPDLTNGPNGIPGIPNLELFGWNFGENQEVFGIKVGYFGNYFWAELVLILVIILIFVRLNNSRIGRAWVAIREDETAAAAMGVNTIRLKLLAFAIGAFLAGAAGTLNAHVTRQVSPDSYVFDQSILLLAAVVLGGMGTIGGAILGSAAIIVIPEKLRFFQEKRILFFGLALILMMRFRPEGIVANKRRQREFHEAEGGADASSLPPGSPVALSAETA